MIPYGLGALLYVPLAGRFGVKTILAATMAVYAVTNFICTAVDSIQIILFSRIFMGLAAASVIPLCLMSIGTLFPKETRGRLVGLFFSTSFIASVFGIVVSGLFPWRWLFMIPALLAAVTALLIVIDRQAPVFKLERRKVDYLGALQNVPIRNILIFIFAISFLYHGVHKWLGVYLHRIYDAPQWMISFFFMLIAVFGAVGQNFGGYVTDRIGRRVACELGVFILSVMTMLLWGKYSFFVLGMILSILSIGWAIGHNGISTVLTDFPDKNRAEIAGLNSSVRFFSGGLGFLLGGSFVEKDFGLTFLGFGVLMFLALIFLKNIIPQEV